MKTYTVRPPFFAPLLRNFAYVVIKWNLFLAKLGLRIRLTGVFINVLEGAPAYEGKPMFR
jgi:hypothetical protein